MFGLKTKILPYIVAFFLPILIFLICFATLYLTNHEATVIFRDAGSQYIEFLGYYRGIFLGDNGIIYSLSRQLGNGTIAFLAYYLLSPFNLISLLFPENMLSISFFIIILTKIGCAGLTAFLFLNHLHLTSSKLNHKTQQLITLAFSASYALCGFVAMYFWSTLWLDAVIALPIIALGVDRIIHGKSPFIYTVSLAFALFTNYYMAFMLCIFACLWLIYRTYLSHPKRNELLSIIIKFIFSSLLAGGISAIVLIPTYFTVVAGSGRMALANFSIGSKFALPALFQQFNIGAIRGIQYYDGLPNIFIGTFALLCIFLYFINSNISKKERIASGLFLLIFVLSLWLKPLNTFWHAGTNENWFPYRYSFIFCFVLLVLAYRGIIILKGLSKRTIINIVLAYTVLMIIAFQNTTLSQKQTFLVYFSIGIFILTCVFAYKISQTWSKKCIYVAILLQLATITINLFACFYFLCSDAPYSMTMINDYITEHAPLISEIKTKDSGLYRIGIRDQFGTSTENNLPLMLGYYGTTDFTSNANSAGQLLAQLGFCKTTPYYAAYCDGSTVFAESLLGIKYIIKDGTIRENSTALNLAISLKDYKNIEYSGNTFEYQNQIAQLIGGDGYNIYKRVNSVNTYNSADRVLVHINNDSSQHLYFHSDVDGTFTPSHYTLNGATKEWRYGVIDLGNARQIDLEIETNNHFTDSDKIYIYSEDEALIKKLSDEILSSNSSLGQVTNSHFQGSISTQSDNNKVLLTIPYDRNWQVFLDGNLVSIDNILNGIISINIKDGGIHQLDMYYHPKGLAIGIAISCASSLILILLIVRSYRLKHNYGKAKENLSSRSSSQRRRGD